MYTVQAYTRDNECEFVEAVSFGDACREAELLLSGGGYEFADIVQDGRAVFTFDSSLRAHYPQ